MSESNRILSRPLCPICLVKPCRVRWGKRGVTYRKACRACLEPRRRDANQRARRKREKCVPLTNCERCGFVPEDPCQIDHHHVDGDHSNDSPDNLRALCANCHRLITKRESLEGKYLRANGQGD